jgi:hypothetical protein
MIITFSMFQLFLGSNWEIEAGKIMLYNLTQEYKLGK